MMFGKTPAYEQDGKRVYKARLDGIWERPNVDLSETIKISDMLRHFERGTYIEEFLRRADSKWGEVLEDSDSERYNVYISRTFKYVCRRFYR